MVGGRLAATWRRDRETHTGTQLDGLVPPKMRSRPVVSRTTYLRGYGPDPTGYLPIALAMT